MNRRLAALAVFALTALSLLLIHPVSRAELADLGSSVVVGTVRLLGGDVGPIDL